MFKRRRPEEPVPPQLGGAEPASSGQDGTAHDADGHAPPLYQPLSGQPRDSGLGVPPFRPAPPKDAPAMSRSPLPAASVMPPSSSLQPGARPGAMAPARTQSREPAERRTLVVGRGISVQGVIQDAERLIVEGIVEAQQLNAIELVITPGGMFRGTVEVEEAEIAGTIDGNLTARAALIVRSTGRVLGTARCRRLQVEDGGQITGQIEMITEQQPKSERPAAEVAA